MPRDLIPKDYQSIAIDFFASTPRCALYASMGLGKTSATLLYLDAQYNILGDDHPTLVLAPKRVAVNTWPSETRKWNQLQGLEVVPITGPTKDRIAALKRNAPVFTTNYDNLPWLVDELDGHWPFRRVVADESTRLKNYRLQQGGARAAALGQHMHKNVKEVIELTGTPTPNGLKDLWGQMWMLDGGKALGLSFESFKNRWFQSVSVGTHGSVLVPLAHAFDEITAKIKHLCLTLDAKDYFDLKEPVVTLVPVYLPKSAREKYETMEREMFADYDGGTVTAVSAAGKTIKCLQMASGFMYLDAERYGPGVAIEMHAGKLEALESIIAEANGMPILVSYWWKHDLVLLKRHFPEGREFTADQQCEDDWNAGKIPLLFIHPQSAGHGVNLQDGGNILVFYSHWWDMELHDQVRERNGPTRQAQSGHDRAQFVYYLVAEDTADEAVIDNHTGKRAVQDAVVSYMKRKRKK